MAHAKARDLEDIESLLIDLSLHFHIKAERRYIHVYETFQWIEVDVPKPISKRELKPIYKEITQILKYI